ncbi:MAG TPA: DUF123 domain-containing protein [Deltaproteobacteria bacterium]|nr:DUF123 domain-containing protein [Deltaproteobacteria bacterium]
MPFILLLARSTMIQVGKLGSFIFPAGHYAYIGSAFGSGGLHARIQRHIRKEMRVSGICSGVTTADAGCHYVTQNRPSCIVFANLSQGYTEQPLQLPQ